MSDVNQDNDAGGIILQTRSKPVDDDWMMMRVWESTYKKLVGIRAKMELSSREATSMPQVIDAIVSAIDNTRIKVEDEG